MVQFDVIRELLKTDNYLLEQYYEQGEFENSLWRYYVNRIRLIAILDKNEVKVLAALQRISIDNASEGGLYAQINLETGNLHATRSHVIQRTNF